MPLGIDQLFPPGVSPEERGAQRLAAMERRLSELEGGYRESYAESAASTTLAAGGNETTGLTLDILVAGSQFIQVLGSVYQTSNVATDPSSASARIDVAVPSGAEAVFPVYISGYGMGINGRFYSVPGANPATDVGFMGAWSTFWASAAGVYTFTLKYVAPPSSDTGASVTHSNPKLWVRY